MSTITITPEFIQGAITIESGDGYVRPWRTDYTQKQLYPSIDDNLVNQMSKPVGTVSYTHLTLPTNREV